jgi:DNA helicase-2/ATP-dependent DNA helicase PcrA
MVSSDEYIAGVTELILSGNPPNEQQIQSISHAMAPDLMIVAGPGSGKTTVLVLRALKHVIVDGVLPEHIVITTFTKKAAAEIRSRLIMWGIPLFKYFRELSSSRYDTVLARHLSISDVNGFITGTLDSLCEQWMGRMRRQGEIPPVMLEAFAAKQIFSRQVFGAKYQDEKNQSVLNDYLARYTWEQQPPFNQGEAVDVAKGIIDRLVQDRTDIDRFAQTKGAHLAARRLIAQSLRELHDLMCSRGQLDFALLESEFLRKCEDPALRAKLELPKVLLIDEYQDTNPLQEAIYFLLAKTCQAAVTIVGDDDQALYRFRGATVELFRDFRQRFAAYTGRAMVESRYLTDNYRSTKAIVGFCNRFIANDPSFKPARVDPPKPEIVASGANRHKDMPVLGMFRSSPDELARDVAALLHDVFRGNGRSIPGTTLPLRASTQGGDLADAVFMAHSVAEFGRPAFGNPAKARIPWLLRQELERRNIPVFNPRGRALKDIPEVSQLLGLVCLCIDPAGDRILNLRVTGDTKRQIAAWRAGATAFIDAKPAPNAPHGLGSFVNAWQKGRAQVPDMKWPREWPVLDLLYKLLAWMPQFQHLPEYQVYLEAVTRSVTQATGFSPYQGRIMREAPHAERSRESVLRDILAPIAQNVVDVDEELLTHLPRNHLNVMTIHQSKGLEFPLVIVDVGADFKGDYPKARFKRFPESPSNVTRSEDDLAPYTEVGSLRTRRTAIDRTFEDLIRLYYVAYSRPQTALLLVGHTNLLTYTCKIKNIATFWQQSGSWPWRANTPAPGKRPPASVANIGIVEL